MLAVLPFRFRIEGANHLEFRLAKIWQSSKRQPPTILQRLFRPPTPPRLFYWSEMSLYIYILFFKVPIAEFFFFFETIFKFGSTKTLKSVEDDYRIQQYRVLLLDTAVLRIWYINTAVQYFVYFSR